MGSAPLRRRLASEDMAVVHALVMALALLALVCLPALVAVILSAQELVDRLAHDLAGWRVDRRQRRTIGRLDRTIDADPMLRDLDLTEFDRLGGPAFEQIAADLRRLGGHRLDLANRSQVWHSAVLRAYDDQLQLASRCLRLTEHLDGLDGVDREIERVRVEGELQAAGLLLPAAPTDRR